MKKKNVKSKKILKLFLVLLLVGIVVCFASVLTFKRQSGKLEIGRILKSKEYSYLPDEAKEYISSVYKVKGTLLLTEKNKKKNEPYLNPEFVKYLTLNEKEKEETEIIPDAVKIYNTELYNSANSDTDSLPSKFNLKSDNGKDLVTPNESQGNLGLCWAFASLSQLESKFLVDENNSYSTDTSKVFSKRQLDYATASNGINSYTINSVRNLGNGGNYRTFLYSAMSGVVPQNINDFKEYKNGDYSKEELYKVLNYGLTNYEADGAVIMSYTDTNNATAKNNFVNELKTYVKKYGGAYVATSSPTSSCAVVDDENNTSLIRTGDCTKEAHAMHIVGWDDNYSYTYCNNNGTHEKFTSSCSKENTVAGKGAWILKNSWGNFYPYVYLAYDSDYEEVGLITKISDKRTWDNVYGKTSQDDYYVSYSSKTSVNLNSGERLEKVKFIALNSGEYKIYLNNSYVGKIDVKELGLNTFYVTKKLITSGNEPKLIIKAENGKYVSDDVQVFTSNVDKEPKIKTEDYKYTDNLYSNDTNYYKFYLYSETKNIPSNAKIEYKLYDKDGVDYTNMLSYEYNLVAKNNVNTLISVNSNIKLGEYNIKTIYNGKELSTSSLELSIPVHVMEGSGTKESPYLVKTIDDLYKINSNLDAYYSLQNDIDLKDEYLNPIAFDTTLAFTGVFDGNNHKIKFNLKNGDIEEAWRSEYFYSGGRGLFSKIGLSSNHDTIVKNLKLEVNTSTTHYGTETQNYLTGALAGYISDYNLNSNNKIYIDNISLEGSYNNITVGGLIGLTEYYSDGKININNVSSYIDVGSSSVAGELIGEVKNINTSMPNNKINISNIAMYGNVSNQDSEDAYSSKVIGKLEGNINLENAILLKRKNAVNYNNYTYNPSGLIVGNNVNNSTNKSIIKNVYYEDDKDLFGGTNNFDITNVVKKSTYDLLDENLYNNWSNFNEYWELKVVDGVKRMPTLKNMEFLYSKVNPKLSKLIKDEYYYAMNFDTLYGWLDYDNFSQNLVITSDNDKIVEVDEYGVTGVSTGTTKLHIKFDWDGYIGDTDVSVIGSYKIKYVLSKYNTPEYSYGVNQTEYLKACDDDICYVSDGYTVKNWNTKADGTGTSYKLGQEIYNLVNEGEEITLYGMKKPIEYTVEFLFSSDLLYTNKKYTQILTYDKLEKLKKNEFEKEGYLFAGWRNGNTVYSDEQEVINLSKDTLNPVTLYAQWTPINYSIKYDSNSGTGTMDNQNFTYDVESKLNDNNFTRKGYKFASWNTKADGTGVSYDNQDIIYNLSCKDKETVILYAQWTPINYSIKFDSNNGTGIMNNQTLTYDKEAKLNKNLLSRDGYIFANWNTKADGTGISYSDEQNVINLTTNDNDIITLYAIWQESGYIIKYDSNGASGNMNNQIISMDKLSKLSKNTYKKDGYIFTSWNTKADGSGTSYKDEEEVKNLANDKETIVLYAIWSPISYSVKFDGNSGLGSMNDQVFTYDKSSKLNENTFTKENYVFVCWNTKSDGTGINYNDETEILNLTKNNKDVITLYAIWRQPNFTVKFDSNGASGTIKDLNIPINKKVKLTKNAYKKEGYKFTSWNTKNDGSGTSYKDEEEVENLANDKEIIVLYAIWSPISYSVKFDGNSGLGSMSNQVFTYDKSSKLTKNEYKKEGYKFVSWNTKNDATGTSYDDEKEIVNLTNKDNDVITLYAIWIFDGLDIKNYTEIDGKLKNINPSTTIAKYKENVRATGSYALKVFDKNNKELKDTDLVFTGSITRIYKDNVVIQEYINIVKGDTDGDGEATSADAYDIVLHASGKTILKDVYYEAGLIDNDDEVTSADAYDIILYCLGRKVGL